MPAKETMTATGMDFENPSIASKIVLKPHADARESFVHWPSVSHPFARFSSLNKRRTKTICEIFTCRLFFLNCVLIRLFDAN